MSNRTTWIDLVKFSAIYLMLVAHLGTWEGFDKWIHAFHMPVFFVVSGYCYNETSIKSLGELVKKRFRSLIIPYCLFGAGLYVLWNISLYAMKRYDEMRPYSQMIRSMFGINSEITTFGVIQWFLTCIFLCSILFYLILSLTNRVSKFWVGGGYGFILLVVSIVAYMLPEILPIRLPWSLDCAFAAVVFYGVGWKLKKLDIMSKIQGRKRYAWIFGILLASISSIGVFLHEDVNLRCISYGNYFLFYGCAIGLSIAFCVFSYIVCEISCMQKIVEGLAFLGRHTLIILLLNSTFVRAWNIVANRILITQNSRFLIHLFVAMVIIIISAYISVFIQRYFPELVGRKRTG